MVQDSLFLILAMIVIRFFFFDRLILFVSFNVSIHHFDFQLFSSSSSLLGWCWSYWLRNP